MSDWADDVARQFHDAYERLAPEHGYETRPESAVAWEDVPEANRALMRATVLAVLVPVGEQYAYDLGDYTTYRVAAPIPQEDEKP